MQGPPGRIPGRQMNLRTFIVAPLVLLMGCAVAPKAVESDTIAPCLAEKQQELLISWGAIAEGGVIEERYELSSMGNLYLIMRSPAGEDSEFIAAVDASKYCKMVSIVNTTFLKTQALHSPGTQKRYIEYSNPTTGVSLRAIWNPELETFQSRDMRTRYVDLMKFVPPKN